MGTYLSQPRTYRVRKKDHPDIIKLYQDGLNGAEIARKYKVSSGYISRIIKANIETRRGKYTLDEFFFKKIDTEEKAYFLGFLYADGYNNERGFEVTLSKVDEEILVKFKKFLNYSGPLYNRVGKKFNNEEIRLCVGSGDMSKDLTNLGCYKAKSFTLKFPTEEQVPKHLLRHFIRGYFDGDGTFTRVLRKNSDNPFYSGGFISSQIFLKDLKNFLEEKVGLTSRMNKSMERRGSDGMGCLCLDGRFRVARLLSWMYDDAKIYLERKYKKYKDIEEEIKSPAKYKGRENRWWDASDLIKKNIMNGGKIIDIKRYSIE